MSRHCNLQLGTWQSKQTVLFFLIGGGHSSYENKQLSGQTFPSGL